MTICSQTIKSEAQRLGFLRCGIAQAMPVDDAVAEHYRRWIEEGRQAGMQYLENHIEKRMDPRQLVEGVRSIVSVAMNYYPSQTAPGIAWYAQGKDYHDLMKDRLCQLMQAIGGHGRCFVDTAPVLERYWAWRCGIGWIGRHSQIVAPGIGSAFFLGELFIEEEVDEYDTPIENHCGNCHKCIEACLTGAIAETFDSRKCLSYLTIENRGPLPDWAGEKMGDVFYGCDRCMKACPHLHVLPTRETAMQPNEELLAMTQDDWRELTVEQYQRLFKGSAVKRAKFEGLTRNISAINRKP